MDRRSYPSDIGDDEWALCAPYLSLMDPDAPQRQYKLREVFNGLRYIVRTGCQWRYMPNDLPPWQVVYQQTRRWMSARVFETLVHDLRVLIRVSLAGKNPDPSAVIMDARTIQSTSESGAEAGYDGAKRRKGRKTHVAVDTLGLLLALHVTPANEQERDSVEELARQIQIETGDSVSLAYVDQGYTGERAQDAAAEHGIELEVVKLSEAKRGFVLLPRRWVVERTFAWFARFRRLARDYERLDKTLKGLHFVAAVVLMLAQVFAWGSS